MLVPRTKWDVVKGHSPVDIGHSGEEWPEWVGNETMAGQNENSRIFTKRVCIELIQSFLGVSYLVPFYLCLIERRNK